MQAAYPRRVREGLMCGCRKRDALEVLVAEAHALEAMHVARLRRDLASSATVDALAEKRLTSALWRLP